MMLKPSEDYYELLDSYKKLHKEEGKFRGISLVPLVPTLINVIKENNSKTLLDYGCGKAIPYSKKECKSIGLKKPVQELCNLDSFALYDPAYPKYSKLTKKKYDIVVCTDVMEHIAEQDIDWVLKDILSHSKKAVFLNISCQPALKHFKEGKFKGQNVHVSVFHGTWWSDKVKNIWNDFQRLKIYMICVGKDYTHIECIKKEKE
mgnify:FL=1